MGYVREYCFAQRLTWQYVLFFDFDSFSGVIFLNDNDFPVGIAINDAPLKVIFLRERGFSEGQCVDVRSFLG